MKRPEAIALLAIGSAALVASGVNPLDRLTWFWDMFQAMVGAILAQLSLSRAHDRELRELGFSNK